MDSQANPRYVPPIKAGIIMAVDVASASYVLSAMASTAKLIEFGIGLHGRRATPQEIQDVRQNTESDSAARFRPTTPSVAAMSGRMSKEIIETIRGRIEAQQQKLMQILTDPDLSTHQLDERLKTVRRDFCWAIHQIKKHNGGALPADLQDEWELSLCGQYNFDI